jgi:hypothetical protein
MTLRTSKAAAATVLALCAAGGARAAAPSGALEAAGDALKVSAEDWRVTLAGGGHVRGSWRPGPLGVTAELGSAYASSVDARAHAFVWGFLGVRAEANGAASVRPFFHVQAGVMHPYGRMLLGGLGVEAGPAQGRFAFTAEVRLPLPRGPLPSVAAGGVVRW